MADSDKAEGAVTGEGAGTSPPEHAWLSNLVRELFQTEQSAKTHPLVEAERLGDVPPSRALRAVSDHAARVLAELPQVVKAHGLPVSEGGKKVGAVFSALRDNLADLLLTSEKSYRGTLLGMRHGVDLVELIGYVATAEGDAELAAFCARWLDERRPLVEAAARELAWFAAHPDRAAESAKDNPLALAIHGLIDAVEHIAEKLGSLAAKGD